MTEKDGEPGWETTTRAAGLLGPQPKPGHTTSHQGHCWHREAVGYGSQFVSAWEGQLPAFLPSLPFRDVQFLWKLGISCAGSLRIMEIQKCCRSWLCLALRASWVSSTPLRRVGYWYPLSLQPLKTSSPYCSCSLAFLVSVAWGKCHLTWV